MAPVGGNHALALVSFVAKQLKQCAPKSPAKAENLTQATVCPQKNSS